MHRVLERQLHKMGLNQTTTPDEKSWNALLTRVNQTYQDHDRDRELLERSLAISSMELRELLTRLQHEASHDALTGLINRPLLLERLRQVIALRERRPERHFALLFIDLDRFKSVNDSLGHAVGDALLIELSKRMLEGVRASDTVARLGGDEFTILLDEVQDLSDAMLVADRLQKSLLQSVWIGDLEIHISASIGIVTSNMDYLEAQDVLRDADIAMYHAKSAGRAQNVVFDLNMRQTILTRNELETDLRLAIAHQELFVCYQPIVSATDNCIVGFEALVRWQHPTKGLIAPLEFIGVAEEIGMIAEIDLWVMETAARQVNLWQTQFPELGRLSLNVNFSSKDFNQPNLHERIKQTLKACRFNPKQMRLEITESILIQIAPHVMNNFERLRATGIQLHIDDFGTGYSSLSYLQQMPIDALKIDRSFIQKLHALESAELVKTMIAMAQALQLKVIAEGVETIDQLNQLRSLGCGFVQGYYLAKPLKTLDTENLIRQTVNGENSHLQACKPSFA